MRPTKEQRELYRELRKMEPGLKALEREIKKERPKEDGRYCANMAWYRKYKPILCELVGWEARLPSLRNDECYDAAYLVLYNMLPDCNGCCCL